MDELEADKIDPFTGRPFGTEPASTGDSRPLRGAAANNRGRSITLHPTETNPVVIVESPKNSGDDAETITVIIGMSSGWRNFPQNPAPLKIPQVKGTIEWGVGGASFSADFDWTQGTVLTVAASYVRVKAVYVPWSGFGTLPDVNISAALAYGDVPHEAIDTAKLSVAIHPIAGGSAIVDVPPFATSFCVIGVSDDAAQPNLLVAVAGPTSALPPRYSITSDANAQPVQFPLHNGAAEVMVTNQSGIAAYSGVIIFTLAL